MKSFYNLLKFAAVLVLAASTLTGCATGSMAKSVTKTLNMGEDLPADMVNRHLAVWVNFDEDWAENYNRSSRNVLFGQGVEENTPEYGMRVARVSLANTGSAMWIGKGEASFLTGAYVPDHLPRLRAGDIVEIRQTGTWDTMKNFITAGEGNIVVRILCSKASPDYEKCLKGTPKVGEHYGYGETHTAYPASVRDYGFTFTPMFDKKGQALRTYPQ